MYTYGASPLVHYQHPSRKRYDVKDTLLFPYEMGLCNKRPIENENTQQAHDSTLPSSNYTRTRKHLKKHLAITRKRKANEKAQQVSANSKKRKGNHRVIALVRQIQCVGDVLVLFG